ncbi:MAG: hypothetical protein AAGI03_03125 [Pseudomonadota bacterium]
MNSSSDSAFTRALSLVSFTTGVLVAYAVLPHAFEATEGWVTRHTLAAYGPDHLQWLLIAWQVGLALLIYGAVRGLLYAAISLVGLGAALLLIRRRGRD